ncbi:SGNH/GDSL hydrolase family protein [Bacillus sp. REN3]|uniref:SGNH/GDSL hydrolase family protein n=1 Tax=Bacillus sp. REN3 TaxID=2802440 RepID=UPI001AEDC10E|nr:SGNH/GDSL hydrolase family protein [Bacillus sp. REN3]
MIFFALSCAAVLFFGNQHWKEKVQVKGIPANGDLEEGTNAGIVEGKGRAASDGVLKYAGHWPVEAQENFQMAVEEGQPFHILIAGSPAIGSGSEGTASLLKAELEKAYRNSVMVTAKSYDVTSRQAVEQEVHEELAAEQADLILLEPFILKDNGYVTNEQAAVHMTEMIEAIKKENPKAVVILQPANPLSKARYYPLQVEALKEYADTNGIPFLDHWQAWPVEDENSMRALLLDGDPAYPNEAGNQIWAEYLIDYFIPK